MVLNVVEFALRLRFIYTVTPTSRSRPIPNVTLTNFWTKGPFTLRVGVNVTMTLAMLISLKTIETHEMDCRIAFGFGQCE